MKAYSDRLPLSLCSSAVILQNTNLSHVYLLRPLLHILQTLRHRKWLTRERLVPHLPLYHIRLTRRLWYVAFLRGPGSWVLAGVNDSHAST
jgi:hypothetical protein